MIQELKTWSYQVKTDLVMADFFITKNNDYTYKVLVDGVGSKIVSGTPDALLSMSCSALAHHIGIRKQIVDLNLLRDSLHIEFKDKNDVNRIMFNLGKVPKTIPLEVLKLKVRDIIIAIPKLSGKSDEEAINFIVMRSLKDNPKAKDFHDNAWVPVMEKLRKSVSVDSSDIIYTASIQYPCYYCQGGGCPQCQGNGFSLGHKISGELKVVEGWPYIVCNGEKIAVYDGDLVESNGSPYSIIHNEK